MNTQTLSKLRQGLCLLMLLAGTQAFGQSMQNFALLAQLKNTTFTTFASFGSTVFLVQGNALVAVDLSNPARPVEFSRRAIDPGTGLLLTNGRYLFALTPARGLQLYYVVNPRAIAPLGRFTPYDTYRPAGLSVDGVRLYFGGARLQVYDITNVLAARLLADLPYPSAQLAASQGRVAVSGTIGSPIKVYDLRDPAHPADLGELNYRHAGSHGTQFWHVSLAMRWPYVLAVDGARWPETYWLGLPWGGGWWITNVYDWSGFHVFTPGYGGSWTRVASEGTTVSYLQGNEPANPPDFYWDPAFASDKVFLRNGPGGSLTQGFNLRTLQLTSEIPDSFSSLRADGNRLYAFDPNRVAYFDAAAPALPLRGVWDTVGGGVVATANGRAYVSGKARGLTTVDVRSSTSPRVVSRGPAVSAARAAVISGQYLYIADAIDGLRVLSLADPDRPLAVRTAGLTGGAVDVAVASGKAYVASGQDLLHIYSVTNPTSPVTVGVLPGFPSFTRGVSVAVSGNYAYVLAESSSYTHELQLAVANVQNPAAPQLVRTFDVWYISLAGHLGDLAVSGNRLYAVYNRYLEEDSWWAIPPGWVYSLADPSSPTLISRLSYGNRIATDANRWAFITGGLHGLDASMVANPPYIVAGGYVKADFGGIALAGKLVYGASESEGFRILRFLNADLPDLTAFGFGLATTSVAPDRPLNFRGTAGNLGPLATNRPFQLSFAGIPRDRTGPVVSLCDPYIVTGIIAPGTSYSLSGLGRVLYGPSRGVLPGKYQVALVVDDQNRIPEISELNNVLFAPGLLTVLASQNDLRPIAFSFAPDTVKGGQSINLSGQIRYTGVSATTRAFWVEFWCSPNGDFSPPRYFLCDSLQIPAGLTPGTVRNFAITRTVRTVAQGLPLGVYAVGVWVDRVNDIPESDESNNLLWLSGTRLYVRDPAAMRNWEGYR